MALIQITQANYVDTPTCSRCQRVCCVSLPGETHPDQWGNTPQEIEHNLRAAFTSGQYTIDWWETRDQPGYFVRPSTKGMEGRVADPSWGGTCTFLDEAGCNLKHEARPLGCQLLKPNPVSPGACDPQAWPGDQNNGKLAAANAWKPYFSLLERLAGHAEVGL